jgi:hypothetical protein
MAQIHTPETAMPAMPGIKSDFRAIDANRVQILSASLAHGMKVFRKSQTSVLKWKGARMKLASNYPWTHNMCTLIIYL